MAAEHLLQKGYPHLAYVGIDEVSWSNTRKSGLLKVAESAKSDEPHIFSVGISWLQREPSLTGLTKWLRQLPMPCGIMAANDVIGYRVGVAAAMAGIRLPEELGIIGVDNDDVFCELSQPAMSSISCDCERIGMEAAAHLYRILSRGAPAQQLVIPPLQVVERQSTDIFLGRDNLVNDAKKFIVAHVGDGINVSDVVTACNLSRRALERRFNKAEGHSIHHAIHEARLVLAKSLIVGGKSIGEASYAVGFRTAQHFHHAFKKRFDMTPMQYLAATEMDPIRPLQKASSNESVAQFRPRQISKLVK
jgi:LacI family transcriptional regulator